MILQRHIIGGTKLLVELHPFIHIVIINELGMSKQIRGVLLMCHQVASGGVGNLKAQKIG